MNTFRNESPSSHQAAVNGLAVAGFITLMALGIWLAIYSTRFVPTIVGNIGAAAVYIGSVFTPSPGPALSVVPTASTTIPFSEASSTISTNIPATSNNTSKANVPITPTAGQQTTGTYLLGTTTPNQALSGLPDLVVTITASGYLATTSTDSFVAGSIVPSGSRPAIKFTVKNIGTNMSGAWTFQASIPTQTAYVYQSAMQQSLAPGDSIDYTLGFDQANKGSGKVISITVNPSHTISESNLDNNTVSTTVTILGS